MTYGSSTYGYTFRGKTSNKLYRFAIVAMPASLLNPAGGILEFGTYNGETIVLCNQSGEVRRSTKANDPQNPYGVGVNSSPWESNV